MAKREAYLQINDDETACQIVFPTGKPTVWIDSQQQMRSIISVHARKGTFSNAIAEKMRANLAGSKIPELPPKAQVRYPTRASERHAHMQLSTV
jgi:hypothetical protein